MVERVAGGDGIHDDEHAEPRRQEVERRLRDADVGLEPGENHRGDPRPAGRVERLAAAAAEGQFGRRWWQGGRQGRRRGPEPLRVLLGQHPLGVQEGGGPGQPQAPLDHPLGVGHRGQEPLLHVDHGQQGGRGSESHAGIIPALASVVTGDE